MAATPPTSVPHGALIILPPTLATTLGAIEIGVMLAAVLYGVTTLQTYIYWQTPKRDKLWLRSLVACLWSVCALPNYSEDACLPLPYQGLRDGSPSSHLCLTVQLYSNELWKTTVSIGASLVTLNLRALVRPFRGRDTGTLSPSTQSTRKYE